MSRAAELQDVSRETGATLYLRDGPEQVARDAAYGRLPETQPWWFRQTIWKHDVRDALAPI